MSVKKVNPTYICDGIDCNANGIEGDPNTPNWYLLQLGSKEYHFCCMDCLKSFLTDWFEIGDGGQITVIISRQFLKTITE